MIPSNPPLTTSGNQSVDPPSAPASTFAVPGKNPELPPVKGSLPYSRQDYEQLPEQ